MSLKFFKAQILIINTLFNIEVGVNITRKSVNEMLFIFEYDIAIL